MVMTKLIKAIPIEAVDNPFWPDTKSLLESGSVTPFISNCALHDIFGDPVTLAGTWADDLKSPLPDEHNRNLARVAQYYSIRASNREAKRHYLDSLKNYLLGGAQQDPQADQDLVKKMMRDYRQRTFSELADRLGYPRYEEAGQNPLRLLAELPLPVYLTTCHHNFLEVALSHNTRQARPVSEIYYWRRGLEHIPSIFETEPGYEPSLERPLVYHLYGLDSHPESLVLTEDDYLDFLVRVTQAAAEVYYSPHADERQKWRKQRLPNYVLNALSTSLLLIGYNVYSWDFSTLVKGLIQPKNSSRLGQSISMQLEQGEGEKQAEIRKYLIEFFDQSKFKVYWGTPQQCARDLWEIWEG
jgi:hypothetical protein